MHKEITLTWWISFTLLWLFYAFEVCVGGELLYHTRVQAGMCETLIISSRPQDPLWIQLSQVTILRAYCSLVVKVWTWENLRYRFESLSWLQLLFSFLNLLKSICPIVNCQQNKSHTRHHYVTGCEKSKNMKVTQLLTFNKFSNIVQRRHIYPKARLGISSLPISYSAHTVYRLALPARLLPAYLMTMQ